MTLKPLKNNVLVRPLRKTEEVTQGGIVVPVKKVSPTHAEVIAVGPEANPLIKVGQLIQFQKFQGYEVEDCIIMPDLAILAILEGGGK